MTVQEIWALGNFYNSVFSGEQIDEAIGVILNGGIDAAVDAAEASAAAAAKSAQEAAGSATDLGAAVKNAQSAAGLADSSAKTAESYAKGGTGTREGEDTDNAKYYCEQTRRISGGEFIVSINGEGADETGNFTLNATKVGAIDAAEKGTAGGVAELDDKGKVPAGQLPAAMTPAAHADTHKQGGSDPLTAADIGAATVETGTWTPTDINGAGFTLTSAARYAKCGSIVNFRFSVSFRNKVSDINVSIGGLPFTPNGFYVGTWHGNSEVLYGDAAYPTEGAMWIRPEGLMQFHADTLYAMKTNAFHTEGDYIVSGCYSTNG